MSMVFRQVAAAALAVAVIDALRQSQGPPVGHLEQLGLAFVVAFIVVELMAGWHILWRQLRPWVKRLQGRTSLAAPGSVR